MYNEEIWKDIDGFKGLYQVSSFGRVKSFQGKEPKIMSLSKDKYGYYKCCLHKDTKEYYFKVHRLVAQTFIPNPNKFSQVNHKDEYKTNNYVENLEWCTIDFNLEYGTGRKRSIEHRKKPIEMYDKENIIEAVFPSLREASEETKIDKSNISACCLGKVKTAGGFIWKYREFNR